MVEVTEVDGSGHKDADLAAAGQRIAELERVLRHYVAECICDDGVSLRYYIGEPGPRAFPCRWCRDAREALGQRWTGEQWEMPA